MVREISRRTHAVDRDQSSPPSPKPAASLMLLRDGAQGPEVLMVKRPSRGAFPNLYVFPGGKVHEDDDHPDIHSRCSGLDDRIASRCLGVPRGGLSYWIACVRECFEETGVLLAQGRNGLVGGEAEQWQRMHEHRRRLNAGETLMAEICASEDLMLRLGDLVYCSHWVTPRIERRRFTTRFFAATLPPGQNHTHDERELVDSLWIRPEDALDASDRGEMFTILPTQENLREISGYGSATEAVSALRAVRTVPTIMPKFVFIGGTWCGLLPEDPRYHEYEG